MLQKSITEELAHADVCLRSARVTLDASLVDAAFNRLYYAVFHATRALLASKEIVTISHKGVYAMLTQELNKPGLLDRSAAKLFSELMGLRATADYGYFTDLTMEQAELYLPQAEAFVEKVKELLRDTEV